MIRFGTTHDTNSIISLFNTCFPEDIDFNEYFFAHKFCAENTLLYVDNGSIVAMLIRLPYFLQPVGSVTYLYGCCTLPKYRGKGIMSALIDFSHSFDVKKDIKASILIPATTELFSFYSALGYTTSSFLGTKQYCLINHAQNYTIESLTPADIPTINAIYEHSLISKPHLLRTSAEWQQQISLFSALEGYALKISQYNQIIGYVFSWDNNIQEVCSSDLCTEEAIINCILTTQNITNITASPIHGTKNIAFAMLKSHFGDVPTFYLNLMYN